LKPNAQKTGGNENKYDLRGEENGEYDDVEDDGDYVDRQADHDLLHPLLHSTPTCQPSFSRVKGMN
jgi:hypothetical protein